MANFSQANYAAYAQAWGGMQGYGGAPTPFQMTVPNDVVGKIIGRAGQSMRL